MSWSSRQVLGFTALILGVIITAIVAMVTLVLFLTMGSPPEGQPLLITMPTATPTTDEAPPTGASCEETPEDAFVFLPQFCVIITSSPDSQSSPLTIEFLPYFNMRRCPNQMCHDNSCHGDRCCCQAVNTSSLTYYCPNERGVLIPNIVERCGCIPCSGFPVVFVGMVTNTNNTPIPMAEVSIDHTPSFTVSEEAIFGFSVSSLQESVVVKVTARGYWEYSRLLRVLPGEVNVVRVVLMVKMVTTVPPTHHPVLISTLTLDWQPLTSGGDLSPLTPRGVVGVESLMEFPAGTFSEGLTVVGQAVSVGDMASMESLGMSFVTGVRGRRSEGVTGEMVMMVSMGMVDLVTGEGVRVTESMSGLVFHTIFSSETISCLSINSLQLFLMVDSRLRPLGDHTSCSEGAGLTRLSITLPPSTPLPFHLILGATQQDTCYVAVRAFETTPTGAGRNEILETQVWLHTREEGPPIMANVMLGRTGECVSIPCQGELVVRILDGLQYTPESYIVHLDDDVIMTSDEIAAEAEVYRNLSECERNALGPHPQMFTSFEFVVKPRQPALMGLPTPNGANLTTPPFCSLRVGVVIPVGVASVYVTAVSVMGEGVRMVRVERVGDGEDGREETGSGVCSDCEKTHITCLQVSCDHQVEVGVSGEDVCVGVVMGGGVKVEVEKVILEQGKSVKGLVQDSRGPDASIAMEMCKLGTETDVLFRCIE